MPVSLDGFAGHHAFQPGENFLSELFLDLRDAAPFGRLHPRHDLVYQRSQHEQLPLGDEPAFPRSATKRQLVRSLLVVRSVKGFPLGQRAVRIAELDPMAVEEEDIITADVGLLHGKGMKVAQRPCRVERHLDAVYPHVFGCRVSQVVEQRARARQNKSPRGCGRWGYWDAC